MKPHRLIDFLLKSRDIKNDSQLCRIIDFAPPHLSRIRAGKMNSSSNFILAIHENLNIPVSQIRELLKPQ